MNPSHQKTDCVVPCDSCDITYEGILVPGSTGVPANMAAQGG